MEKTHKLDTHGQGNCLKYSLQGYDTDNAIILSGGSNFFVAENVVTENAIKNNESRRQ